MNSMFYFIHVAWVGCKHRPQFIAEHLRVQIKVDVFHLKDYQTSKLVDRDKLSTLKVFSLFRLPFQRFKWIAKINTLLLKRQVRKVIGNYDSIWLTHPSLYKMIASVIPPGMSVFYDCMDDALEFPSAKQNPAEYASILENEKALLARANCIFVSSNTLGSLMVKRGASSSKVKTINNAVELAKPDTAATPLPEFISSALDQPMRKMIYVGTTADWFDFEVVIEALDRCPSTVCLLFGLADVPIPKHPRLIYVGMVEHRYVARIMAQADLLIMPFLLNDLVLSVNPIKLYEYAYSGRPSLAVRYPETEQFSPYVHLYRNRAEFIAVVEGMVAGTLVEGVGRDAKRAFALGSTWQNRVGEMLAFAKGLGL